MECVEYIKESARIFGERLKGYFRAPTPINDHADTTGHLTSLDNFSTVASKSYSLTMTIKEAMYIRVHDPSLNRNIGKY